MITSIKFIKGEKFVRLTSDKHTIIDASAVPRIGEKVKLIKSKFSGEESLQGIVESVEWIYADVYSTTLTIEIFLK